MNKKDTKLVYAKWPETQPKKESIKLMFIEVYGMILLGLVLIMTSLFFNNQNMILARNVVTGCALLLTIILAVYVISYLKTGKLFYCYKKKYERGETI